MAYIAPGTVVAGDVYTASAHNIIVNDVLSHESRIKTGIEPYTTTERNALTGVATGTTIFNTTEKQIQVYNGSSWIETNDIDNTNGVPSGLNPFFAGYTTYTPTLTQLGAVPKTTKAYYIQVGKFVHGYFELIVSGAGGTAGNRIEVTLPVAIRSGFNAFTNIGCSTVYDASTGNVYPGFINMGGALTLSLNAYANGTQYIGINSFGAALANGDYVGGSFTYEAA